MTTNADRKLLALGVKSAVFTAKELSKLLEYLQKALMDGLAPTEQKSYGDFQNPGGVSLLNVSTEQKDMQSFAELSRKNGVNVSVKHNQDTGIYYLCLQGQQNDIKKTMTEFQSRLREQSRSLSEQLEHARVQSASRAEKAKTQERECSGRNL